MGINTFEIVYAEQDRIECTSSSEERVFILVICAELTNPSDT